VFSIYRSKYFYCNEDITQHSVDNIETKFWEHDNKRGPQYIETKFWEHDNKREPQYNETYKHN